MGRVLRSLHVQLFLWAVMPVTFVIIALSFTGVYAHQQTMRDFVVDRDMGVARMMAQIASDGLAHGAIGGDGSGLAAWMLLEADTTRGATAVIDARGRALAHSVPGLTGTDLSGAPGTAEAIAQRQGSVIVDSAQGRLLVAFAPVEGTEWTVLVQEPVDDLIGPILRFPSIVPTVAAGASILSLLILTFGWLTIVRPLQQLARAAEQVSWGDYGSMTTPAIVRPTQGVQEVRDLQQALVDMVERIQGYEAGMRDYLGAVTRGQEAERARVARELHDGPVQGLIALGQRAEMAQRLVERGHNEQAQSLLDDLRQSERMTVQELRRLIGALRPIYLEDLGFLPALEALVQQAAGRTQTEVRLEGGVGVARLTPEVELAAYRIAQEALNNALLHAQAEHIVVRARYEGQTLLLTITDDGTGFDLPRQPNLLTRAGHFGLIGMQERAALLGGTLEIRTAPGQGTRVAARLPDRPSVD